MRHRLSFIGSLRFDIGGSTRVERDVRRETAEATLSLGYRLYLRSRASRRPGPRGAPIRGRR
ncbi:hypothetical protein AB4084_05585, partial [Lysobacter sp. 2RAB21]